MSKTEKKKSDLATWAKAYAESKDGQIAIEEARADVAAGRLLTAEQFFETGSRRPKPRTSKTIITSKKL